MAPTGADRTRERSVRTGRLPRALTAALLVVLVGATALLVGTRSAVVAAGPEVVGEWRFDESGGQLVHDGGPNGLHGLLGSSAGPDARDPARIPGLSGGALQFRGDSSVRVPDATALAPPRLTVEAVVRSAGSPGAYRYIVSRGGQGCFAGAYGLYTAAAGGIAFYVLEGSRYVVSAVARPADVWDGRWHHVAATFDGSGLRLFVDGRPVGAPSIGPARIDYAGVAMTTAFGRYVGTCDLPFSGDVDLVRLWSGALSSGAVNAAAARELQPSGHALPPGPLPAGAPATRLRADRPNRRRNDAGSARPHACTLSLSRTRIAVGRRTTVRVRVTVRGEPAKAVRVLAHRRGRAMPLSEARTGRRGRARLTLRLRKPGRVVLSVAMRPRCAARYIKVTREG